MLIGVDLDNTIINYDRLFGTLALERGWPGAASGKKGVRDRVRELPDGEAKWQELQAEAYGPRLGEAEFFPGVVETFRLWRERGDEAFVVSHKTRYAGGGTFDLRESALGFLADSRLAEEKLLDPGRIFFCGSRDEKISRIVGLKCRAFVDDLVEVFDEPSFPRGVRKIHFAPGNDAGNSPPDALICRSWDEIAEYDPELDGCLALLAGFPPRRMTRLGGGKNSRVWLLETGSGRKPVIAKRYCRASQPGRDRLRAESGAFSLLRRHGLDSVPEVLGLSPERDVALYSRFDGENAVLRWPAAPDAVEPFVRLTEKLWRLGKTLPSGVAGPAAEACLSLDSLRRQIEGRLERLLGLPSEGPCVERMRAFARDALRPLFETRLAEALDGYAALSLAPEWEVPAGERVLSPSDFGCHNSIRLPDGELAFIDFEYFGWDDPVKLLADFVLHPGMALSGGQRRFFLDALLPLFEGTAAARRLDLLKPLFAVKWCCILLNGFLPEGEAVRRFSGRRPASMDALERQLAKARLFIDGN